MSLAQPPLAPREIKLLRCPECRGALGEADTTSGTRLACTGCGADWPVRDGVPVLYREPWVKGTDRLMRVIYDGVPRLHDPAVDYLLPVMQLGGQPRQMRMGYIRRLELAAATPARAGEPLRILEVSVGAGASIPLVLEQLPPGMPVSYWGLDLSSGMMAVCARKLRRTREHRVRLVQADGHRLPFADASFDRVFHVGGIGGFSDPGAALAEMARVAVPGSPIVVVDEQLDPRYRRSLWRRAWFKAVTFYDSDPHSPVELLPADAQDVLSEQITAFYYCLRFRMPG